MRGEPLSLEDGIKAALAAISARSPFRSMATPGRFVMSVMMINFGAAKIARPTHPTAISMGTKDLGRA